MDGEVATNKVCQGEEPAGEIGRVGEVAHGQRLVYSNQGALGVSLGLQKV